MKKNRDYYKKLISKLSAAGSLPSTSEGIGALIEALMEHAADEGHAARVVDRIIATGWHDSHGGKSDFATATELIDVCHALPSRATLPDGCDACGGTGWKTVTIGGYDASKRCHCGRGKALMELDARRAEEAAARSDRRRGS